MNPPGNLAERLIDLHEAATSQGCRIREWRLTHDQVTELQAASGGVVRAYAPGHPKLRFDGIPIRIVGQGNFT